MGSVMARRAYSFFSSAVYIQYYSPLVSDARQSGQRVVYFTEGCPDTSATCSAYGVIVFPKLQFASLTPL